MKLQLEWARAMPLRDARRDENLIYTVDWAKLPETCGVYVFAVSGGTSRRCTSAKQQTASVRECANNSKTYP